MEEFRNFVDHYCELAFFPPPRNLYQALYDEEIGFLLDRELPKNIGEASPEEIQLALENMIKQSLEYHKKVCGTKSHSGKHLGCHGPCAVELKLPSKEARDALVRLSKISSLEACDIPFTSDALRAL